MDKKSQKKNRNEYKKLWLVLVIVTAALALISTIVLIGTRNQQVDKAKSFEKVSRDFDALYDATVSSYGTKTSKLTCSNLNMKFSEGSLICDTHLEIEFGSMDNIDALIDIQLRESAVFDVISKDDARTVYGIDSMRWRVRHKESSLTCTIDRATYSQEQYQNKYHRTIGSSRVAVVGDCSSDALDVIPKGYSYLKN